MQRILILEKWILKIIKIDNMKKYKISLKNKIIFKISFMNNFTNLEFYNFFLFWVQILVHSRKKDNNLLVALLTLYVNLILK